jgi:copper(I)-binding protein
MIIHRTVAALALMLVLSPAAYAAGAIRIDHPWSRPTPPGAPTAVGYMTIVNRAGVPDRLEAVSSPAAATVSVHSMSMAGGVMRMRPVEGGLAAPAKGQITLGPDGDHLMFEGLKRPFRAGDRVPVVLTFAHAGRIRAALVVQTPEHLAPPAGKPASGMAGMAMH